MRRTLVALAAALLPVVLLAGCSSSSGGDAEFAGTVLDPPFEVDGQPLTDTDGASYSLADDTDKPLTLVFFGYTHCPDICGLVMSNLTTGLTQLDAEDRDRVDVVFVTTDPTRDDPDVLRDYLAQYADGYVGLTGPLDTISAVAEPLGIAVEKGDKLPSGGYDVTHGTQVIGIDGDDQAPVFWGHETSAAQFRSDIETLLSES
ncbi:SCO family protein [Nocardioides sp. Soil805]|uniref:SCO family protein n=1 Tax=Nocardioides sp. Soil805 TaxID=1736416 RepID=UPI0007034074|nr:SCO family protein [Nocardioides sp. Soil805]KRF34309.1 electron transport protein SCO1/SenC [Nocardioides sp. Soil805]